MRSLQGRCMRRREFITLVSVPVGMLVRAARAQQPTMPLIGYLNGFSPEAWEAPALAFRNGLQEQGYLEGKNVAIAFRWAEGHTERLAPLAAELVRLNVAVLVATGGSNVAVRAKAAAATTPIVFGIG